MVNDFLMGMPHEIASEHWQLIREEQARFSQKSYRRAVAASKGGIFANQIAPVIIAQRKGEAKVFDTDECPKVTDMRVLPG